MDVCELFQNELRGGESGMRGKKILVFGMAAVMSFSLLAGGCGKSDSTEQKEKIEEVLKVIGKEAKGENIYKIQLENKTGKNITGVSVKDTSMAEYPENMLPGGEVFEVNEKRNLYCELSDEVEQLEVQFVFDDQTTMVLTSFPFDDMKKAVIFMEDEVAFLEYKSVSGEKTFSTKETELAAKIAREKAKAAEEAEAAKAAAEAEAAAKAAAEAEAAAKAQEEAEAAARAKAEAEAAERAKAEAEEAARKKEEAARRKQEEQQETAGGSGEGCVDDGLIY